jgi:DNA-binding transcriptional LysR family regulator
VLRELRTLLAIARHGTFAAAGEEVGLTQSAVSAQVRRMEEEFGAALFDRDGRSARLSEAGRALLPLAEQWLAGFEHMREQLRGGVPGEGRGVLRVGAIPSVQSGLLPDAIATFRQGFPKVELRISPGPSMQLLNELDAGALDMALVIKPPFALPRRTRWQALIKEPYVLIAPQALRRGTPAQMLAQHPFIRYDRLSFGGRPVQRYLEQRRLVVQETMELKELEAIVRMVERGIGVSIIPRAAPLQLRSRALHVVALEEAPVREIGLALAAAGPDRPFTAAFNTALLAAARAAGRVSARVPSAAASGTGRSRSSASAGPGPAARRR